MTRKYLINIPNSIRNLAVAVAVAVAVSLPLTTVAQDFSQVEFRQVPVMDGLVMLQGAGGNIAASGGADGLLIIDDDYEGLGDKLLTSLKTLNPEGPEFVLNTHWHFDHAGNNRLLGRTGAIIVAHEKVRERLQAGGMIKALNTKVEPADKSALPVVTYENAMTVHWNGWKLSLEHASQAHTDGDTVVYFYQGADLKAVHTGDLFFNGFYPFIDASSGGSARGMVDGVAAILARIDNDTRVIPGHGPLASKADLQVYYDFLKTVVDRIESLKRQGKSIEQVIEAEPLAEFEAEWGDGFLKTKDWIQIVYGSL